MLLEKLKKLLRHNDEVRIIRDPIAQLRQQALLLLVFLIAIFSSHHLGEYASSTAAYERDVLLDEKARLESELASERVKSAVLKLDNDSVNEAVKQVREVNSELRQQISDLEADVTYYQRVMNPMMNDKGLRIDSVNIEKTLDERRYWLNMVITQLGKENRSPVKGEVQVLFKGSEKGEKREYSLDELKLDKSEPTVKFRFRYYQEIGEEFQLPENFTVEQYVVLARSTGSKSMQVNKEEAWPFNMPLEQ